MTNLCSHWHVRQAAHATCAFGRLGGIWWNAVCVRVCVCVIILLYFFYSLAANVAIWVNILHVNLHVIAKYWTVSPGRYHLPLFAWKTGLEEYVLLESFNLLHSISFHVVMLRSKSGLDQSLVGGGDQPFFVEKTHQGRMPPQQRATDVPLTCRWNLLHVTVTAVAARGFSKRSLLSVTWQRKLSVTCGSLLSN